MVSTSKFDDSIAVPTANSESPGRLRIASTRVSKDGAASGTFRRRQRPIRPCGQCHGALVHISRNSFWQFLVSCFGFYPYLCEHCAVRVFRSNYKQLVASVCLAFLLLSGLAMGVSYAYRPRQPINPLSFLDSMPALSSKPAKINSVTGRSALTNEDIMEFAGAKMSPDFLLTVIRQQENHFRTDAKSLTALKRAGVTEDVLLAMIQAAETPRAREDSTRANR
jgi:hypothetical protein